MKQISASQNTLDNHVRWNPANPKGHYESFFLKANDPDGNRAFWLKFTILSPVSAPDHAVIDMWAIAFNTENGHVAVKQRLSIDQSRLGFDQFSFEAGTCELSAGKTRGEIAIDGSSIEWDFEFLHQQQAFLRPFPIAKMYEIGFPKAKLLSPYADTRFTGTLKVNGETWDCNYWKGMQGHNWGTKHTDHYLWLHCSAFDDHDDTFIEGASAKLKIGPVMTPYLTFFCLQYDGKPINFNAIHKLVSNEASFRYYDWSFRATNARYRLDGRVFAKKEDFVGLHYENPDGSLVNCLNSKIAHCDLQLFEKTASGYRMVDNLRSSRAAFEILTNKDDHGIPISA